ncbi:MAG: bifunctional isocitrate dehydrogenase kinase/phosphatase [Neisseriaceae bacterium]|nr:MAG: bifunctional isocitrate dehydrogenase kinase/phosphatase [Neisseriaceae bacterium]
MSYLGTQQAQAIADTILSGFNRHYTLFRSISAKAKELFEAGEWLEIQKLVANRIRMYDDRVLECVAKLKKDFAANVLNEKMWKGTKLAYIVLLINHKQPELAETFFNSVSNKILGKNYFNNKLIFLKPAISTEYIESETGTFNTFYPKNELRQILADVLNYFDWKIPFADIEQDIENVLGAAKNFLKDKWPLDELNLHFKILHSPFYRNKCAYIFGQIINGHTRYPFSVAVIHNSKGELVIDTVLFEPKQIAGLFSFSRAYFLVDMDVPSGYVNFLKSMLPMRDKTDFYTMLGLQKQSKNIFFRDFAEHLRYSSDDFILAPGIKGLVMIVFTLPSFPYVFKIIKDYFGPNKNFDRTYVKNKYELVKKHDRVGRLADTLEYTNVAIPLSRCSEELLTELKELAPSQIKICKDLLIIKHVYIERRLKPLNIQMKKAPQEEKENLVIEYGNTLKDLATANIFPGDMLYKNFGLTSYGKLIFYDYDEIEYMTNCNFKKIPPPPNPEYELSDEVWYPVQPGDVFPEEFAPFLLGDPEVRKVFLKHHKDLLTPEFWQKKKDNILAGVVEDFFPYPESLRFKLNARQLGLESKKSENHE